MPQRRTMEVQESGGRNPPSRNRGGLRAPITGVSHGFVVHLSQYRQTEGTLPREVSIVNS